MDDRYDSYCAADRLFYDSLGSAVEQPAFAAARRPVPDGWRSEPLDDWLIYAPEGGTLPQQGWKIHVSATLDNAERVLTAVWDYCIPRGLSFKFLRGPRTLLLRNSKYAARAASGKFVTVYPRDTTELELACKELDDLLAGEPGPYILSDLRHGAGPVRPGRRFVRSQDPFHGHRRPAWRGARGSPSGFHEHIHIVEIVLTPYSLTPCVP